MSIEARNRPLPDWFTKIRTAQTRLPRFQRGEAWDHSSVTQIFNTVLQGLPVGAALILEIGNDEPFISRTLKGAPEDGERVTEHLLDGQQRVTALWRGLHNNYDERTYFLFLKPDDETGMPYYVASVSRWKKEGDAKRRPFWADDPAEQWKRRMIPLDLLAPDIDAQGQFREWAKRAIEGQEDREKVADQAAVVRQAFASFNLPFLSLPVTTKRETALDDFIKMNTSAEPLSIYDVVVAQVESGTGRSLHDLVAETKESHPAIANYYPVDQLALYASALLQSRSPTNSSYLAKDFGSELLANWHKFLDGVGRAVDFLEQERVFDAARLPTDIVVPVLVAFWGLAPKGLDAEGRSRAISRRYLWRAFFSDRYEKSTSSRSLTDFNELKALSNGTGGATPIILDDEQSPLPEPQQLLTVGWPVRRDRIARAVLAVSLKHGGLDLADGSSATRANLARREYHHLFPVAQLSRMGMTDDRIYISLNCALVTWRTNRSIGAKTPERYLAERRDGSGLGEAEVRARLASHLIPYDEMVAGDYDLFLHKRAEMIHAAMKLACAGEAF